MTPIAPEIERHAKAILVRKVVADEHRRSSGEGWICRQCAERGSLVRAARARLDDGVSPQELEFRAGDDLAHGGDAFLRALGRLPVMQRHGGSLVFYHEPRVRPETIAELAHDAACAYRITGRNRIAGLEAPLEAMKSRARITRRADDRIERGEWPAGDERDGARQLRPQPREQRGQ